MNEFSSPYVRSVIEQIRQRYAIQVMQVEYTQMATYGGDILVEHDVTFDLHQQMVADAESNATSRRRLAAQWDLVRWKRFEERAVKSYPRVVVMSDKDAAFWTTRRMCVSFPMASI